MGPNPILQVSIVVEINRLLLIVVHLPGYTTQPPSEHLGSYPKLLACPAMESSTSCTSATATRTSRFWSDALRLKFHRQVAELHQRTEMPVEERHYRGLALTTSNEHEHPNLLPFDHELQLADNIAFLAHWKEGVSRVSAVTLQEHPGPPGRLVVLLSSNSTPSDSVIGGLEKIGRSISLYAAHRESPVTKGRKTYLPLYLPTCRC